MVLKYMESMLHQKVFQFYWDSNSTISSAWLQEQVAQNNPNSKELFLMLIR